MIISSFYLEKIIKKMSSNYDMYLQRIRNTAVSTYDEKQY